MSPGNNLQHQWRFNGSNLPINGVISTVAGNGTSADLGDGGLATAASLNWPVGVVVDAFSNIFISEPDSGLIRKVDANGIITTYAGNGGGIIWRRWSGAIRLH